MNERVHGGHVLPRASVLDVATERLQSANDVGVALVEHFGGLAALELGHQMVGEEVVAYEVDQVLDAGAIRTLAEQLTEAYRDVRVVHGERGDRGVQVDVALDKLGAVDRLLLQIVERHVGAAVGAANGSGGRIALEELFHVIVDKVREVDEYGDERVLIVVGHRVELELAVLAARVLADVVENVHRLVVVDDDGRRGQKAQVLDAHDDLVELFEY